MNLIIPGGASAPHSGSLRRILRIFGGLEREYNWLLTDVRAWVLPDGEPAPGLLEPFVLVTITLLIVAGAALLV